MRQNEHNKMKTKRRHRFSPKELAVTEEEVAVLTGGGENDIPAHTSRTGHWDGPSGKQFGIV